MRGYASEPALFLFSSIGVVGVVGREADPPLLRFSATGVPMLP